MGRIIAVANQKGGVGKTTTSINLSTHGMINGVFQGILINTKATRQIALWIHVDSQNLLPFFCQTCCEINIGECMIVHPLEHGLDLSVLPANRDLAGAEVELVDAEDPQHILKNLLKSVKKKYDFIIIDCPPALGMLTINSMTAADTVLVPIQCEFFALDGLSQLIYTINLIKKKLNKSLEIEGVVFTMYDARTNLSLEVVENVKNNLDQFIYKTIIPRNVRLAEAPSFGLPINLYDSRSSGAQGYRDLADEVINNKLYAKL